VTLRERALYHQIHSVKLATDVGSAIVALVLLFNHRLAIGLLMLLIPPILASAFLMAFGRLDDLRVTRGGERLRQRMTGLKMLLRLGGMVVMCVGAWRHEIIVVLVGGLVIAWVWLRVLR
jgi:hypothetical protein